jgi:hypothetical protein
MQIPNSQTSIIFWLANILPRPVGYRSGGIVLLNSNPLESSNDGSDFSNKIFREKDNR